MLEKTYKELASLHFKDVFTIIEEVCRNHGIPVYLIGAHARILLMLKEGLEPARGTKDIDFAIMIPDIDSYDSFMSDLIDMGFRKVNEPYRVILDKTNTVVDILPFGQIEEEGTVKFTDRKTELSVIGMEEVLDKAIKLEHEGFEIKVPPLVGIIVLKLISWDEKLYRTKDLDDIYEIIRDYFNVANDEFYEKYTSILDELNEEDFMIESGAFMIGIGIKNIIEESSYLKQKIIEIIDKELGEEPGSIGEYFLQQNHFDNYRTVKRIFSLISKGISYS